MNDNAVEGPSMPNYGHLCQDDTGAPYITEAVTLRKLYKHAPCEICGTCNWTYRPVLDIECGHCKIGRIARNEDERVSLVLATSNRSRENVQSDLWGDQSA